MADNGKLLQGQAYDPTDDIVVRFTERMFQDDNADGILGQARTDITPHDEASSQVRVWESPATALDGIIYTFASTVNLQLPDVLVSVTITYNKSAQSSTSTHAVGTAVCTGTSGGLDLNPSSSAQAGAAVVPDAQVEIAQTWGQNVPVTQYFFYLAGNVTTAAILAKLQTFLTVATSGIVAGVVTTTTPHGLFANQPFKFITLNTPSGGVAVATTYFAKVITDTTHFTYSATAGGAALAGHSAASGTLAPTISTWPVFRPVSHTLTLKGMQVSLQQSADSHHQDHWNTSDLSKAISPFSGSLSEGQGKDVGVTVRTVTIPPTIHPLITLSSTSDTADAATTVKANIPAITGTGLAPSFSSVTNEPTPLTLTATGSVTPTSLATTGHQTSIPVAGLYLYQIDTSPYKYGYATVRAILVDFSFFA